MKTNKAYKKRIKFTKSGKVLTRRKGQNHFNAKESRTEQHNKARFSVLKLSQRIKRRFLSGINK